MLKNTFIILSFIAFLSCTGNDNLTNCIQTLPLSLNTDLNNPQLINAQTPGGYAEISGGNKGILLFNKNGSEFVAFDKLCPRNDCNTPMTFENRLLKCTCHDSYYSVDFGGKPQTEGFECPAIEYKVTKNGTTIRISNF
ncbi:Rieske 2Fe-2S domain-containing protein [Polaribacter sp. MSW13]|uniref:Rieske 2Fe-2S domain-containing protein n=1 Tax=Polaribacter marinus TaxID=2916838 RepID=A0A9X1VMJ7_9FLAO|nr:Rieske 2Fe-2S domain-containing protein [Polaribacter marinus]MCI2228768.1 Rieske 2Fe-2S domain-containing protein [Polaribacter marinus]